MITVTGLHVFRDSKNPFRCFAESKLWVSPVRPRRLVVAALAQRAAHTRTRTYIVPHSWNSNPKPHFIADCTKSLRHKNQCKNNTNKFHSRLHMRMSASRKSKVMIHIISPPLPPGAMI